MNTITGLAVSNDRKNRTRSILIIISIALTTMLLTIIASFCYGFVKSNRTNAKQLYGNYYGTYNDVNEEQLKKMKLRSEFSVIGQVAYSGEVKGKRDVFLFWGDDTAYELGNLKQSMEEGTFPVRKDQIAANRNFFKELGYDNPKIGDMIQVSSRPGSDRTYESMNFVISGFLKDRKTDKKMKKYAGYVSKEFYEAQVPPKERVYSVYFRLADSIDITYDDADDLLKELADKCGISEENVSVNDYYLIWALDPGKETLSGGILIAICVILFSVIVIYNIFQVGIVQKIQEYGKLKAIGATRKQLKRIVLREGMLLALIGIPIGLLLGSAIGELVFSWLMKQSNAVRAGEDLIEVSIFSVPIILLVIGVSILTVYVALRKPMRIVARISSIEAIRYKENGRGKRTVRKGRKIVGANALMAASLSGNRRRTIVTVCTMGLSCVLLVVIANFVENIDSKYAARGDVEYGQFQISLDYSLDDTAYPENNLDRILKDNPLGEDMIAQIKQLDGVTDVRTRKVLAMKRLDVTGKGSSGQSSVAVVNREEFNRLCNQGESVGNCDYDLVTEENALLFGWSNFLEYNGYSIGQKMQMQLENGVDSISYDSRILGSVEFCNQDWVITEDTYRKLGFGEGGIGYVWVDCKEEDIQNVNKELNGLLSGSDHIEMNTFQDAYKMSQFSTLIMRLASYAFLAILGVIGFLNMANTIIVSIITRKQELGILQAIGMTNRQLNRMLQIEGCIYTVGTVLVAMIVGIPAGYAFFLYGKSNSWAGLNIYHFPLAEILIMVTVIAVMQIILSFVLSRNIRKESLVERIRYQE